MNITLELWKEYTLWCRDNKNKGYTSVYAPDFVEFMSWCEQRPEKDWLSEPRATYTQVDK